LDYAGVVLPSSAPDLIELELLDSIAELGSLGRAAARHGMSQPAVSQRMTQLERNLAVTLLRRTRAGTSLTPAGERIAVLARRVLGEAYALMAGVAAVVAEEGNHLRVAASLTVAEYLLPGWLSALHRESPNVSLAVEVTNSAKVFARVRDASADVGFVEGHETRLGGMSTVVVRSDHLVVVVAPGHPWARRTSAVAGPELAAADLIVREPGSGTREVLDKALGSWGGARSWLELGSTAPILAAARRGEGPAVLSALAVAEDVGAGRLVAVRTDGVDLSRSLRAVWPADRPLAPLARRLLNVASHKQSLCAHREPRSTRKPGRPIAFLLCPYRMTSCNAG
jgi:DNA-binding transcriptional LysR family regulator